MVHAFLFALCAVRWALLAAVEGVAIADSLVDDESPGDHVVDGTAKDETKGEDVEGEDGTEGEEGDESMAESVKDLVSKMSTLKELLGTVSHNHSPEMLEQMALLNAELAKLGIDFSDNDYVGDRAEKLAEKCFSMTYKHFMRSVSTKAHIIAFSKIEIDAGIPADLASNPLFRASATCMLNITPEEVQRFDQKLVPGLPVRLQEVMQMPDMKEKILTIDIEHVKLLQDLATERRYEYEELDERERLNPNYGVSGILLTVSVCFFFVSVLVLGKKFYDVLHEPPRSKAKVKKT
eukprot:GEMP01041653.1.p1 GENE.GEMP01041653.1~~GEMP01041653.1.p1  ORF type:complete len:293 (+),score=75.82 GEMP01041653.1:259-1137(+)